MDRRGYERIVEALGDLRVDIHPVPIGDKDAEEIVINSAFRFNSWPIIRALQEAHLTDGTVASEGLDGPKLAILDITERQIVFIDLNASNGRGQHTTARQVH